MKNDSGIILRYSAFCAVQNDSDGKPGEAESSASILSHLTDNVENAPTSQKAPNSYESFSLCKPLESVLGSDIELLLTGRMG